MLVCVVQVLVRELDGLVGTVVGGLKAHGFWDSTLLLVHTDNGGELVFPAACGEAMAFADKRSAVARDDEAVT